MSPASRFTRLLDSLPATVPFVAPEALERRTGKTIKARLGANESMFGISPLAKAAMEAAICEVHCYGDPECFDLRQALAKKHGVKSENIVVGAGIDDLFALIARAMVEVETPVVMSLGGYPTFAYSVNGAGGTLHRVPYVNDKNDLSGLVDAARESSAKLVYLANPDNPTGSFHTALDVENFMFELPRGATLILDEAYAEFAPEGETPKVKADDPRVIRMRTFSKLYGLAGARLGYAITAPETVAAFDKIRSHFGVNRIAQAGALASLADEAFAASVVSGVEEGRRDYARIALATGFTPLPSATNFVTIDVGSFERAKLLVDQLLVRGVFVRMPGAPPQNRCIRVSVGVKEQRDLFEEALHAIVASGILG